MNRLTQWFARLYTWMLRLYPRPFRDVFQEEMAAVFSESSADTKERGWMAWLRWCGREIKGVITLLVRERWLNVRREGIIMNQSLLPEGHAGRIDEPRAEKPVEILAGVLPFILFGLMFTLKGVNYGLPSSRLGPGIIAYLVVHVVLVIGLGLGWAWRFPRWSYAYLGVVVMTTIWLAGVSTKGFRLFGYTFGREQWGWRGWVPLLALVAIMLVLTRSFQPIAQLFQGMRRDWTRLSFALYGADTWILMGVAYDGKTWYNQVLYLPLGLFLLTLAVAGGAYFYMRGRRQWPRVLALQTALILFIPISVVIGALDGDQSRLGSPPTVVGWFFYLLMLLAWFSVPLWPGIASHAWRRFRPRLSAAL